MNQNLVSEMLFNPLEEPKSYQNWIIVKGNIPPKLKNIDCQKYYKAQEVLLFDGFKKVEDGMFENKFALGRLSINFLHINFLHDKILLIIDDGSINASKDVRVEIRTPQHLLNEVEKYNDGIEKPVSKIFEANALEDKKYVNSAEWKDYESKLIQIPWSKALIKQLTL